MTITLVDVKKISTLACIKLLDEDVPSAAKELDSILQWIETLQSVDTQGIQPLINTTSGSLPCCLDVSQQDVGADIILKNAPKNRYNYFVIPKVVE